MIPWVLPGLVLAVSACQLVSAAVQNTEHLDSFGSILFSLPVFSEDNAKAIFDILQTDLGKLDT